MVLLARAAETIAGRRIAEDGTLETLRDLPAALNKLAADADQARAHPFRNFVQQLMARPELADLRRTNLAAVAAAEDEGKVFQLLHVAAGDDVGFPEDEEYPLGILDRGRLDRLAAAFAEARKLAPAAAERLIAGLFGAWRQRTDAAAVLTRWHFQRRDESDRKAARAALAKLLSEIERQPREDDETKSKLASWKKAWEADLESKPK